MDSEVYILVVIPSTNSQRGRRYHSSSWIIWQSWLRLSHVSAGVFWAYVTKRLQHSEHDEVNLICLLSVFSDFHLQKLVGHSRKSWRGQGTVCVMIRVLSVRSSCRFEDHNKQEQERFKQKITDLQVCKLDPWKRNISVFRGLLKPIWPSLSGKFKVSQID